MNTKEPQEDDSLQDLDIESLGNDLPPSNNQNFIKETLYILHDTNII